MTWLIRTCHSLTRNIPLPNSHYNKKLIPSMFIKKSLKHLTDRSNITNCSPSTSPHAGFLHRWGRASRWPLWHPYRGPSGQDHTHQSVSHTQRDCRVGRRTICVKGKLIQFWYVSKQTNKQASSSSRRRNRKVESKVSYLNPNTSKYHRILHGIVLVPPGVKVFHWKNGPRLYAWRSILSHA